MENNKDLFSGHEKEIMSKASLNSPLVSNQFPNLSLTNPIPGGSLSNQNVPLSGGKTLGGGSQPNANLPVLNSPASKLNISNINDPTIKEIQKETKEIRQDVKEVQAIERQASSYKKQIDQIKKDSAANAKKLEKMLEDQAQGRKEIKALKDKQLEEEKLKKLQQQYLDQVSQYKNPQKLEAEIKQNASKIANSDLLKNDKVLQGAQKEMAVAKKKYGEFQSIKNLPKRPLNPMSQLPMRERIYPGVFVQAWNGKYFSLDVAPQVYYKVTTRFDVGTGFVYRFNYDFKKSSTVSNRDLYGFKLLSNFKIYKTFYFRVEGERIHWQQPVAPNSDVTYPNWSNALLGGIGKEFSISKKIQGNTLVLYNALDKYNSPYSSKVLFRIGLNFSLKNDQRREFIRSLGQ